MDFKIMNEIGKPDYQLSHYEFSVLVALAISKYRSDAECSPTVKQLSEICRVSQCKVKRTMAILKQRGIVSVIGCKKGKHGVCNIYDISLGVLGVCQTPKGGSMGVCQTPKGGSMGVCQTPKGGGYSGNINSISYKLCVCKKSRARDNARTRTHTREGDFVFDVATMSAKLEIPQAYIEERLKEWEAVGWTTTKGVQITKKTVRAQLKAFWKCEKNQAAYLKTPKRARTFTFEDWALCRECCANAKAGGGCRCGVAAPPDQNEERPHRPEECAKFKAKETSEAAS